MRPDCAYLRLKSDALGPIRDTIEPRRAALKQHRAAVKLHGAALDPTRDVRDPLWDHVARDRVGLEVPRGDLERDRVAPWPHTVRLARHHAIR